jgi:hypothetical protein
LAWLRTASDFQICSPRLIWRASKPPLNHHREFQFGGSNWICAARYQLFDAPDWRPEYLAKLPLKRGRKTDLHLLECAGLTGGQAIPCLILKLGVSLSQ